MIALLSVLKVFQVLPLKGEVSGSNPIQFLSNSADMSSRSVGCHFCVRGEKENAVIAHTPGSVNWNSLP